MIPSFSEIGALIGLTEVVFGPLWAWLGAGEAPGMHALTGGAIVQGALAAQALMSARRVRGLY